MIILRYAVGNPSNARGDAPAKSGVEALRTRVFQVRYSVWRSRLPSSTGTGWVCVRGAVNVW
jgi:hypothetical protein